MADVQEKSVEEKVVEYYDDGYSQKDISAILKISPLITRRILQENGFETRSFRALDDHVMNIVIQLVSKGVLFTDIEDICDIAFLAIRDIVARNNLQYVSRKVRNNNPELAILPEGFVRNVEFAERYRAGESFCTLCKAYELSAEQILNEFLSVTKEDIQAHKVMFQEKVLADVKLNFSTTAIARRHCVSMSIVRKILREQGNTK